MVFCSEHEINDSEKPDIRHATSEHPKSEIRNLKSEIRHPTSDIRHPKSYDLVSDTSIIIAAFGITLNGVPETSHIKIFTADRLIIKAPVIATPGGIFGRTISLSR